MTQQPAKDGVLYHEWIAVAGKGCLVEVPSHAHNHPIVPLSEGLHSRLTQGGLLLVCVCYVC